MGNSPSKDEEEREDVKCKEVHSGKEELMEVQLQLVKAQLRAPVMAEIWNSCIVICLLILMLSSENVQ